jgi:hypothetical protein
MEWCCRYELERLEHSSPRYGNASRFGKNKLVLVRFQSVDELSWRTQVFPLPFGRGEDQGEGLHLD